MSLKTYYNLLYIALMSINNKNTFALDGKETANVDKCPYLGSTVIIEGGSVEDARNKISKSNGAFNQL
jgi:hypothetical protein